MARRPQHRWAAARMAATQAKSPTPLSNAAFRVIFATRNCLRGNPLMNVQDRSDTFDLNKYGVGQPVRRTEDPVLVQGHGRYTDDLHMQGEVYAVFVRSRNG